MKEIEVLVEVYDDILSIKNKFEKFDYKGLKNTIDEYYYDPKRDTLKPDKDNQLSHCLRVRSKNNECSITYKDDVFDNGKWLYSNEYETEVEKIDMLKEIFNKLGNSMNKDAVCLFDVSENFNNKVEKKDEFLFKTFCNSVNSNVEVYYTSNRYKDFIEFLVRYKLSDKNREVLEKEKYTYYDKDLLLKGLEANNLSPVKIDDGYGEGILKHKHIYHCRRIK